MPRFSKLCQEAAVVWAHTNIQNGHSTTPLIQLPDNPDPFPTVLIKLLRSAVVKFVWSNPPPRVKHSLLSFPKLEGGTGLPDFALYNRAALPARIVEWSQATDAKLLVQDGSTLSTSDLRALPLSPTLPSQSIHLPLTVDTLKVWHTTIKKTELC